MLKLNSLDFNHDIKFALKATTSFAMKDLSNYSQAVLNGQKFQSFLELCFGGNATGQNKNLTLNSLTNLPTVGQVSPNMIQLDLVHA